MEATVIKLISQCMKFLQKSILPTKLAIRILLTANPEEICRHKPINIEKSSTWMFGVLRIKKTSKKTNLEYGNILDQYAPVKLYPSSATSRLQ